MKVCTKCGIEKRESEFGKNKKGKGGLRSYCKKCKNDIGKRYRTLNSSSIHVQQKLYRERNKSFISAIQALYRKENKDKLSTRKKDWRKNNPKKLLAQGKRERDNLSIRYIKHQLRGKGYNTETLNKHHELIELQRIIIKTKRLWRKSQTSKNSEKA